jgi:hypothetical protein
MSQWSFFDCGTAYVSTAEFHSNRPRAKHLEQPAHRGRLLRAADYVRAAVGMGAKTVSDLGCGDGGLLSLIKDEVSAWGYDFCPANEAGWEERGVTAWQWDVFNRRTDVKLGEVSVVTEVLEHLTDPHDAVRWIADDSRFIVASSPWDEGPWWHDECHAWAWDREGYRALIEQGGYRILNHENVGRFQIVLGVQL